MRLETQTTDRKALAKEIGAWLGREYAYDGVPNCTYSVGDLKIERDGSIVCYNMVTWERLLPFFREHGWTPTEESSRPPMDMSTVETATAPQTEAEPPAPDLRETEDDTLLITLPTNDITPLQLRSLINMLYSKQELLNRAFGKRLLMIPDRIIDALKRQLPETPDDFTALLNAPEGPAEGFDFRDGKATMTFPFDPDAPTNWTLYTKLFESIISMACETGKIRAERPVINEENEKYLMHNWFCRLRLNGPDFKELRKLVQKNLRGHCAFNTQEKADRFSAKIAAGKLRKKTDNEEANE